MGFFIRELLLWSRREGKEERVRERKGEEREGEKKKGRGEEGRKEGKMIDLYLLMKTHGGLFLGSFLGMHLIYSCIDNSGFIIAISYEDLLYKTT